MSVFVNIFSKCSKNHKKINLTLGYIGQEATDRLEAGIIFKPDTPTMLGTSLGLI